MVTDFLTLPSVSVFDPELVTQSTPSPAFESSMQTVFPVFMAEIQLQCPLSFLKQNAYNFWGK